MSKSVQKRLDIQKPITRADAVRMALEAVPLSWLDTMLTGPAAVVKAPPYDCKDVERICFEIRRRIEAKFAEKARGEQP